MVRIAILVCCMGLLVMPAAGQDWYTAMDASWTIYDVRPSEYYTVVQRISEAWSYRYGAADRLLDVGVGVVIIAADSVYAVWTSGSVWTATKPAVYQVGDTIRYDLSHPQVTKQWGLDFVHREAVYGRQ